jgi:stage II sporulation protein R
MKKIILCVSIVAIVCVLIFAGKGQEENKEYLRIHIRANSNSSVDQEVKYKVRDEIVECLIPILSEVETFKEAKIKVEKNFDLITKTANQVLMENGFDYTASVRLNEEEFPTRQYGDLTLESGIYDALIIDLGTGEGNNWWCLVYPAFCFTESKNSTNLEYISQILEIIKSIS